MLHFLDVYKRQVLDNETINEEMRILYVALTRASQKLVLTGGLKEINMIEKWQKQVIDYALDASCHLLPATIRKSNQMLNWIMLALIRHPDFIQQCIDLSLFDEKIKNYYDLDQVKNNALQLKLYQENKMQLNTCPVSYTHLLKKAVLKIQGHDLSSYSLSLIDFIEHSFCKNELVYALLSSLKLEGTEPLSLKEYLSLLQEMFSKKTHSLKESYDSLYLLNYNQPYSERCV